MSKDNNRNNPADNTDAMYAVMIIFFVILTLSIAVVTSDQGQRFIESNKNIESTERTAIIESIDHTDTATIIKTPDGTSIRFPENITENYNSLNIVSEDGSIDYTIKSEPDGTVTGYVIDRYTD